MIVQENLHLERYKLVTDRQKYCTKLAKEAFVELYSLGIATSVFVASWGTGHFHKDPHPAMRKGTRVSLGCSSRPHPGAAEPRG